jgi:PAS domain S-box-containing protein
LAVPFAKPSKKILLFDVNISWFLTPFLKNIRSGKTGYAWIVDHQGTFLFHPYSDFIGGSAFIVRSQRNPESSYQKINFIQKESMLKGEQGTSWYYSDWHRGFTGQQKKLIAYHPITISENPPQKWSVAVVAPVTEVEGVIRSGFLRQMSLQGMIIFVILAGVLGVLFFEIRWSRVLEQRVNERTNELKRSEEKYRSLVESAEDFIFTLDSKGMFQSINSFTANFFGGRPEDFVGQDLFHVFPDDIPEKQLKIVESVFEKGKSVRDEFELKFDNQQIWINANFMPLKNQEGEVSSVLCIARDITENKRLEKQLINTEKLASLGTLAAGVAHEINNPMSIILGFCDLLLQKAVKGSQEFEDLKTIERQGLHCKEIVENLLSFARFGDGNSQHSDLHHCLSEILKVVRHNLEMRGINLVTELSESMPTVKGDPRQLQQVFLNLISNAMAAMEQGCTLTIRTKQERIARRAVVQFQDNGGGISEDDMDHIFEPFFTTKPEGEGTGLGLFVSYGIIAKYGGTIDCVSSRNGKAGGDSGTVFTVKLPLKGRDE